MNTVDYLLKLQRKYSNNEVIEYQKNVISKLQIEIGMLKSELAETQDLLKDYQSKFEFDKESIRNHPYVSGLLRNIKALQTKIDAGITPAEFSKKEFIKYRDYYICHKNLKNE